MRLYDLANVIRSKNAGPFTLTVDLLFEDDSRFQKILSYEILSPKTVAELYDVRPEDVTIHPFESVKAIKITLPRPCKASSGAPGDTDVYGSSQHYPLADLELHLSLPKIPSSCFLALRTF